MCRRGEGAPVSIVTEFGTRGMRPEWARCISGECFYDWFRNADDGRTRAHMTIGFDYGGASGRFRRLQLNLGRSSCLPDGQVQHDRGQPRRQ